MQSRSDNGRNKHGRSGIACVEFAVVLPFILIMMVGIIEAGSALRASHALQSALSEGGRLAISKSTELTLAPTLNGQVTRDIRSFMHAAGFSGPDVTVSITDATTGTPVTLGSIPIRGTNVRIAASLSYDTIEIFPRRFLSVSSVSNSIVIRIPQL